MIVKKQGNGFGGESDSGDSGDYRKKFDELMERAEPLILQVNSSYNQWATGVEKSQPFERLRMLDQMMNTLMMMAKPSAADRFRFQHVQGTYSTYKKRWEKLALDVESGKIKRFAAPAGPQKKRAA